MRLATALPAPLAVIAPAAAPLWRSAFRPFFLLGAGYGPLLMAYCLGVAVGLWPGLPHAGTLRVWHGHEVVFGFAAAIIIGVVLTALPSWARTEEIGGARLQALAGLWLAGRAAMWLPLPPLVAAAIDCALYPVLIWMLTGQLLSVGNRYYRLLFVILAALLAANLLFHTGRIAGDEALATFGLHLGTYVIILLYVLKSGVLTPVFTGNALREKRRGEQPAFLPWLEILAAASIVTLAVADLAALPATVVGSCAAAAGIVHAVRLARWRGWRVADVPLLLVMHLSYAWLVAAFGIKACAEFSCGVAEPVWLHAFTVGALGLMMIGMMVRVTLRHTGRPLQMPAVLLLGFGAMFAAASLRVAVALDLLGSMWLATSALLWMTSFVVFLVRCGAMLWRPSLPSRAGRAQS